MLSLLIGVFAIGSRLRGARGGGGDAGTIAPEGPRAPGLVEATPIELSQPGYNQNDDLCRAGLRTWTFPDRSPDLVRERLRRNGFDDATREAIASQVRCDGTGCAFDPSDELVLSLPATPRSRLYREFGASRGFAFAVTPYHRPRAFTPWEQVAPTPATRDLFARLTWVEGASQFFVDVPTACSVLTDREERVAFLSLVRRRYSLDVRVRVPAETPAETVARYWTLSGRPVDPARVARVRDARDHAQAVPLRELLDPWPARRVNEFPRPAEPDRDCFWTTTHFAEPVESGEAPVPEVFAADLAARWREIPRSELRYGDAVVLWGERLPEHAMVYLADDLVFTKNGRARSRAWVVARMPEVMLDYPNVRAVRAYRLR